VISKPFVVYEKTTAILTVNAGRDTIIGECKPYQLNALVDKQPGVTYSYLWKPSTNLNNAAIQNPVFTPGSTTTFVVTVTSSKGATATDTVTITVNKNDIPVVEFVSSDIQVEEGSPANHLVRMTSGKPEKAIYHWHVKPANGTSTNLTAITGPSANIIWDGLPGNYTLYADVTDGNGCNSEKDSVVVKITESLNVNVSINGTSEDIVMYPNPTSDWVNIAVDNISYRSAELSVFTDNGREVLKKNYTFNETIRFDMSNYVSKTYYVRLNIDGKIFNRKLIVFRN
jgi:hypothetical protein